MSASEPPSEAPVEDGRAAGGQDAAAANVDPEDPPHDPHDLPPPYSVFSPWQKRLIVLLVAVAAIFSPITAQIYLPALNAIAADLHVSSAQINLTLTTYMVLQGLTPMFVGGLADTLGRRPAYVVCFVVYLAANVGLALAPSYGALLALRCLQSAGSSTTVALCQAVVADLVTSAERGQYIGFTALPTVLAPALGPVVGGLLAQYLGWRTIFWFLAIAAGVVFVLLLLFLPETCRPIVGDGSVRPHPAYRTFAQLFGEWRRRRARARDRARNRDPDPDRNGDDNLTRTSTHASTVPPLRLRLPNPFLSLRLLAQKEQAILLGYSAVVFAGFYSVSVALPSLAARTYGYDDLVVGLLFLPMAAGSTVTAFTIGRPLNRNFRRHARRRGLPVDKRRQHDLARLPVERARLEVGLPPLLLSTAVLLAWGWVWERTSVSVAVPCVLLFVYGLGVTGINNCINVLLIDVTPGHAGAAVAANNLTRCLLGAAFSAAIVPMIDRMGAGWAFVLVGLLLLACLPLLLLLMRDGVRFRAEQAAADAARQARRDARTAAPNAETTAAETTAAETEIETGVDTDPDHREKEH